jgi:putative NIF3 family GTP cyclohydrolase 1 type 2
MTISIQDAINSIIAGVVAEPYNDTVDVVKLGDPSQPLTGIAVTFLASYEVIEQAVQRNANLIITHEPIFYNHLDQTDWLTTDPVYAAKRKLIEDCGLVIWRFHDYMHSIRPDPTVVALSKALGWESSLNAETLTCEIPPTTLAELVTYVKAKLGIQTLRYIGDPTMPCRRVVVVPGFPPPQFQLGTFSQSGADVLICGEIHEWEVSEYIRDAMPSKHNKAVIVIGHAASEEPAMRDIIPWLQERVPGIPIQFIPNTNIFQYR